MSELAGKIRIAEQTVASEFEHFTDIQREQARVAGALLAPGLTLQQHFAPDTATFRELEVWRVEQEDGGAAFDVWLCAVPRGVVFAADKTEIVGELADGRATELALLARAATESPAAGRQLFGRWARRALLISEVEQAAAADQPPPGDPFTEPVPVGTFVHAKWGKRWWPAIVLSATDDVYRVHYDGWESSWDEYVDLQRLCRAPARSEVAVGDAVSVEYRDRWYAASVLAIQPDGRVRVHYDGWESSWDEDVVPARIKR